MSFQKLPLSINPYNQDFQLIKISTTSDPANTKYDRRTYNRIIKKVGLSIKKRKRSVRKSSSISSKSSSDTNSETSSNSAENESEETNKRRRILRNRNLLASSQSGLRYRAALDSQPTPAVQLGTRTSASTISNDAPQIGFSQDPSLENYIVLSDDDSDSEISSKEDASQQQRSVENVRDESVQNIQNNIGDTLPIQQEHERSEATDIIDLCEAEPEQDYLDESKSDLPGSKSFKNESELQNRIESIDEQIVPVDSLDKVFRSIIDIKLPRNLPPTDYQSLTEKLQELKQIRYNQMVNLLQETSENFINICKLEKEKIGIQHELAMTKCKSHYERLIYEQEKEVQKKKSMLDKLLDTNVKTSS